MLASCSWTHGYGGVNYGAVLWVATLVVVVLAVLAGGRRRIGPDRDGYLRYRRWPAGRGRTTVLALVGLAFLLLVVNQWAYGHNSHDHDSHSLGPGVAEWATLAA